MNIIPDIEKDSLYWALRLENEAFLKRQRWATYKSAGQLERQRLGREAEKIAKQKLEAMGYQVHETTHKCPFDLWAMDERGRAIRVEVKISLYYSTKAGGRYQANIHQDADLIIFIARNGRDWPFIIPMADLGERKNIAIWSYCPGDYKGQWAGYLEAWQLIEQAFNRAGPCAFQLSLEGVYVL